MRLRTRILLVSLALCLLFGTVLAGALQLRAFRADLDRELSRGLDASSLFAASLSTTISAFSQLQDPDSIARAIRITTRYMAELALAAVTDSRGALLHDNFSQQDALLLDRMPAQDLQYLIAMDSGGRAWQLIRRGFQAGEESYTLYYAWPLERVYAAARLQARQAALLLAGLSALLVLSLFLSLRLSFQPLTRLSEVARRIAGGQREARAAASARQDEVGELSQAFNHMAEATEQHIELLTQRDAAQKQFIADMAHELKTPLTSMIGYADLVRRSALSDQQREHALTSIIHQGERLSRMGMKLLRLARLEGGEEPEMGMHSASSLMRDAAQGVEELFSERGVQLLLSGDGELLCDPDLMLTLLQNLLSNACKASQPGGRTWLSYGQGSFTVRDEGCGIPDEHLPHLTEAFYMVDKSRAHNQQGAGLGLALCRRIAALHGAALEIKSAPGAGTTVTLSFTSP